MGNKKIYKINNSKLKNIKLSGIDVFKDEKVRKRKLVGFIIGGVVLSLFSVVIIRRLVKSKKI